MWTILSKQISKPAKRCPPGFNRRLMGDHIRPKGGKCSQTGYGKRGFDALRLTIQRPPAILNCIAGRLADSNSRKMRHICS